MNRLPILTHPNTELRNIAEPFLVEEITSDESQALFDDMILTMVQARGIGIAGTQVNAHKRVFVGLLQRRTTVFINPEIIKSSIRKTASEEGCLSVPGAWGYVKRHRTVDVRFMNRTGHTETHRLFGLDAIVFQHELDHLNGVLFIDKAYKMIEAPDLEPHHDTAL